MGRIFITPLAKKLASLNSINIKDITGSGPKEGSQSERHLTYLTQTTKEKLDKLMV